MSGGGCSSGPSCRRAGGTTHPVARSSSKSKVEASRDQSGAPFSLRLRAAVHLLGSFRVSTRMASNRIGIVEILLGVIVVYFAYNLLLYASRSPHVHGDDLIEVRSSQQ